MNSHQTSSPNQSVFLTFFFCSLKSCTLEAAALTAPLLVSFLNLHCSTTKPHFLFPWQKKGRKKTHKTKTINLLPVIITANSHKCFVRTRGNLTPHAGENELNYESSALRASTGLGGFFPGFGCEWSDSRLSSWKSGRRKKKMEVRYRWKSWRRCSRGAPSFWYSDLAAYTQHYDTFGWSHCRINGPALSFSTTMPRFRDAISHTALRINATPKIYINLCLKMKAERGLRQWS